VIVRSNNGPLVQGAAVCLEYLCGWKGPIAGPVRAAFVRCPECGTPAGFMYRGASEKVSV
jgi:hypothetical protein